MPFNPGRPRRSIRAPGWSREGGSGDSPFGSGLCAGLSPVGSSTGAAEARVAFCDSGKRIATASTATGRRDHVSAEEVDTEERSGRLPWSCSASRAPSGPRCGRSPNASMSPRPRCTTTSHEGRHHRECCVPLPRRLPRLPGRGAAPGRRAGAAARRGVHRPAPRPEATRRLAARRPRHPRAPGHRAGAHRPCPAAERAPRRRRDGLRGTGPGHRRPRSPGRRRGLLSDAESAELRGPLLEAAWAVLENSRFPVSAVLPGPLVRRAPCEATREPVVGCPDVRSRRGAAPARAVDS